jgi:hypothetical protein
MFFIRNQMEILCIVTSLLYMLYFSTLLQAVSLVMYPRGECFPHNTFFNRSILASSDLGLPFGLVGVSFGTLLCVSFRADIGPI